MELRRHETDLLHDSLTPFITLAGDRCRRRNASGRCADVKLVHPMPLPPRPSLHPVPVARVSATMAP